MPAVQTRADSLREYFTGASSDGGTQIVPTLCLGGYRSSQEAFTYGIYLENMLFGVVIDFASGGCLEGNGALSCDRFNNLQWNDSGGVPGEVCNLPNKGSTGIVETKGRPASYLRVRRTSTANITSGNALGAATVTLHPVFNNYFGFGDGVETGQTNYRASILRNEAVGNVYNIQRFLHTLGVQQASFGGFLPASGTGTIITTGSFASWPSRGYCNIQTSGGTLREIVYYSIRTDTSLSVPAAGRGLLGTTASAGAFTDIINAVPGIAIGLDVNGIQASGSPIATIPNDTTAPAGVTWFAGITGPTGAIIGTLYPNQQIGIWMMRQVPAGAVCIPSNINWLRTSAAA